MTVTESPELSGATLDFLSDRAAAIYEARLKAILEPGQNGCTVAIHLDSGDHAIGKNSPSAVRALRRLRPGGMVVTMLVGPERHDPTLDRMLARHSSTVEAS
jgi:hypothetical protein